jgi:hypothetical protein
MASYIIRSTIAEKGDKGEIEMKRKIIANHKKSNYIYVI